MLESLHIYGFVLGSGVKAMVVVKLESFPLDANARTMMTKGDDEITLDHKLQRVKQIIDGCKKNQKVDGI